MRRSLSLNRTMPSQPFSKSNLDSYLVEPQPTQKQLTCHICHRQFRLYRKKKTCCKCNLPVCAQHSGGVHNKQKRRICDCCVRDSIYDKTFLVQAPQRQSLLRQFEAIQKKNDQQKKLLIRLKSQIRDMEQSLNYKQDQKQAFEASFSEKIQHEQQRNLVDSDKLENFKTLFRNQQSAEQEQNEKFQKQIREIQLLKKEFQDVQEEYNECQEIDTELRIITSGKIQCGFLRKVLCRKCYRVLKYVMMVDTPRRFSQDTQENKACCLIF